MSRLVVVLNQDVAIALRTKDLILLGVSRRLLDQWPTITCPTNFWGMAMGPNWGTASRRTAPMRLLSNDYRWTMVPHYGQSTDNFIKYQKQALEKALTLQPQSFMV